MLNGRFKTTSGHFICQLHEYLSQNLGSNGHFEVLNKSESLFQKYDKNENMQKRIKRQKHYTDFFFFYKTAKKWKRKYLHFVYTKPKNSDGLFRNFSHDCTFKLLDSKKEKCKSLE